MKKRGNKMRVFYIGKFDYFYSTEQYVMWALNQCNVEVVHRGFRDMSFNQFKYDIETYKPHFVLFSKPHNADFPQILKWCKENNLLTVCWLFDIYWEVRPVQPPQFKADMVFTTDGGHDNLWKQAGINHQVLRQGIHEPEHVMLPAKYLYDVGFVGTPDGSARRRRIVHWLRENYGDRFILHTRTRGIKLNEALSQIRVVVGDAGTYAGFVQRYWSNRIYEILGRGGFLIHVATEGLGQEFIEGQHYVDYPDDNLTVLHKQIEHYLSHDEERESIRHRGYKQCGKYTYTARVQHLLREVKRKLSIHN